ncbi:Polysaccharide lyase family 8, N terminal alpha-helical domain [Mariniphaga anaerophila]|uniref:Polysaccharide lyase family 8, N terminal alpha-helical domain n=1 Tax=Mariniphaga anaerophila TaxID=1484053 RepID=A0A1M4WM13_9BACT|nr:polysaccharide lyase family 8 super-sandwich domain-containing protein [Mariniphaga anaerophila]SHE82276.1 Polysaccharide lyase family 8, N terminal alpha-helical domain [Mariniphaga anaerophila]
MLQLINRKEITRMMNRKFLLVLLFLFTGICGFAQNKWQDALGVVHTALPKTQLLSAADSYFEVEESAQPGDEVIGRVNLANNSFEKADFEITGGTGASLFRIEKFVNSRGKHFGILTVNQLPLSSDKYTLQVKATFNNGATDTQEYTITKVETSLAEKYFEFVYDRISRARRLYYPEKDAKLEEFLSKFNADGSFSDLTYGLSKAGWEGANVGALRINNLAMAYLDEKSSFYKDEALKEKVYTAIIFNANEFAKYRTEWYETHLWRNTDYIAGIGLNYFRILQQEMKSQDAEVAQRAVEVYDAIIDNCDNLFAERMDERPAIGNANRNHRMRSLAVRAAISYDYNRALTDWDLWYDKEDVRIPGFYPTGALDDLMELVETGFVISDTYNNKNGFFPDGTICHHPAVGIQFTADAYGWEWLTEWSIPLADQFKNTPFQAQDKTYNTIAERILDAYRPLTFYGYLDMSVGGLEPDRAKWGSRLLSAVKRLIEAKSDETVIARENELLDYKTNLEKEGYDDPLAMSKAFWNIDYFVQRRPDYFASAKMISKRSRGLERGIEKRSYYYLGDGALFVRVNPDDYNNIQNYYNWHAIPGTSAEQRTDDLPPSAVSAYPGAPGTNVFAGVVSNGSVGFGAFRYERNHQSEAALYSTVNANKGYFFFENEIVALGNNVRRVRPGDGADILTTLNQLEWKGDIVFGRAGEDHAETVSFSDENSVEHFAVEQRPLWVYHDRVGYVIVPGEGQKVNVELAAETRAPRWTNATAPKKMFQLAINHGPKVTDDSYQYIVLPATSVEKVKAFAQSIETGNIKVLKNEPELMAVYNKELQIVEAAFYEPGTLLFENSEGENVCLAVDRPALVMMKDNGKNLEISVTDPCHSTTALTINLDVNIKFKGEAFDETSSLTSVAVTHSSEEVYAGKPVVQLFETEGRFLADVQPGNIQKKK